jgi:hypothetical protein
MTITIELAPELQAELARRAATQGIGIDAYAASLLKDAARLPVVPAVAPDNPRSSAPSSEVARAIEKLKGSGKTHAPSLAGMAIRELRHEARP